MTIRSDRIQDTIEMNGEWFVEILSECQSALIRLRRCFTRRVIRNQASRLNISESLYFYHSTVNIVTGVKSTAVYMCTGTGWLVCKQLVNLSQ